MSSRWYPMFQKGNPQLRVFLPNFWMKLVRPQFPQADNQVEFHVSMGMTKHDIKNYLEKIYNVKTVDVRTRIKMGRFKKSLERGYIIKDEDIKIAYAILPKDQKFVFPDIFNVEEKKKTEASEKRTIDEMKEGYKDFLKANNKPGVPGWYSM
ncbi:39S ribosomal protein L23, mitochondrial [Microplitis demolitor]|uniref:39S ribosomal protein L23, mitochondrial n=1 Tax=Microplitis demolitor TaxID=69319 RepID=UPI0004CCBECD|nr:39S ribosomal protein L23, mitochondrial [Microplitis demolitor]